MSPSATNGSRVAFRVDSSVAIGSGHVVRCLTLANVLRDRKADVRFICREHPGNLIARIEGEGFAVRRLQPCAAESPGNLGAAPAQDASETSAAIAEFDPHWLVTDHYGTAGEWERQIRLGSARLFAIDDFERLHSARMVLNQNWRERLADSDVAGASANLLGPRYALLRPEYAALRAAPRQRTSPAERVLVFFGGSDATNETSKALVALSQSQFESMHVDVVLGASHPDVAAIQRLVDARPRTMLRRNLPSLAPLMQAADVAIGAGGSTTWERLCLRVPSLVTTIADNQVPGTQALANQGMIRYLGPAEATTPAAYADALSSPWQPAELANRLVDGLGALRVAEAMLPSATTDLTLRPATLSDAESLFEWRNDSLARAMSFSSTPVLWNDHVRWLRARLAGDSCVLFIATLHGLPIGQIRFDLESERAILSYSLDMLVRGRGMSRTLVTAGVAALRRRGVEMPVHAFVKRENVASQRVFETLAWRKTTADSELVFIQDGDSRSDDIDNVGKR